MTDKVTFFDNSKQRSIIEGKLSSGSLEARSLVDLESLLSKTTKQDPDAIMCWTLKSAREMAEELSRAGRQISHIRVGKLLRRLGYSLQVNISRQVNDQRKTNEERFNLINHQAKLALAEGQPLIYINGLKNELVGKFKKNWRQWDQEDRREVFKTKDFTVLTLNNASGIGMYDLDPNNALVNIKASLSIPAFALSSIYGWWRRTGGQIFQDLKYVLILIDDRGIKEYRGEQWRLASRNLANQLDAPIMVRHFPPGAKKWLATENRLFSFVASNWRGEALSSYLTNVSLIGSSKNINKLSNKCCIDRRSYHSILKSDNKKDISSFKSLNDWYYLVK
ncbi:MAG: ISAzo13 family transposase [Deltaproteobacteria bacterium]|nr:ISAzo13 family transposase [Deltaproteobacteria bacterium]